MDRLRDWALRLIIALNVVALVVSFGESFAGLFQWAGHHSITGFSAAVWPLMIDIIVLVGEAGLFVAHKDRWRVRDKVWLWFITLVALGVSTGGNVGHVVSTDWLSHLTAALPPVALFFSMTVGFGVMKRVYLNKRSEITPGMPPLANWHPVVDTERKRVHVGETPWAETPVLTEMVPVGRHESPPVSDAETPAGETAPVIPESLEPTETFAGDFKVIPGKSFTLPPDHRPGLNLPEMRVRDMLDVDPDISTNAVAKALGCAWATADKYLKASKDARGLTV